MVTVRRRRPRRRRNKSAELRTLCFSQTLAVKQLVIPTSQRARVRRVRKETKEAERLADSHQEAVARREFAVAVKATILNVLGALIQLLETTRTGTSRERSVRDRNATMIIVCVVVRVMVSVIVLVTIVSA